MGSPSPQLAAAISLMNAAAADPGDHSDDHLLEAVLIHTAGFDVDDLRKVVALLTDRLAMAFGDTQWRHLHDRSGACGFQMPADPGPLLFEYQPDDRR